MTESVGSTPSSRENAAQICFESFQAPAYYSMHRSVLSLFASGRTRGLVVQSGYGLTSVVPIFEGYALPHASVTLPLAGVDISRQLKKQLSDENALFASMEDHLIEDIKKVTCAVHNKVGEALPIEQYELPDGSIVDISSKIRTSVPELLFEPNCEGNNTLGLPALIRKSIAMCDRDLQKDLRSGIVLAGGTSMLSGRKKLRMFLKTTTMEVNVDACRIILSPHARIRRLA